MRFFCFSGENFGTILSRRSRLSRASRAPSRLIRPRPIDCDKKPERPVGPRVLLTKEVSAIDNALAEARAVCLVRDLVNTPAEDLGPAALEEQCEKLAKQNSASLTVTKGDALEQEYPMVHAVGRAAARHHAPRIMHLTWGKETDPELAIVGKGVTSSPSSARNLVIPRSRKAPIGRTSSPSSGLNPMTKGME